MLNDCVCCMYYNFTFDDVFVVFVLQQQTQTWNFKTNTTNTIIQHEPVIQIQQTWNCNTSNKHNHQTWNGNANTTSTIIKHEAVISITISCLMIVCVLQFHV
jgi:hypothetical protein